MMRRRLAILLFLVGMLLAGCSAAVWASVRLPIARFVPPGAHDVRVQELGLGRRLLTYEAPGTRYEWYYTVATRLEHSGWTPPDKWGPPEQINTYTQVTPLWIGFLWEQVELHGEPNHARITLRRWVTFPKNPYFHYVNF